LRGKRKSDIPRLLDDNDIVVVEGDFFRVVSKIVLTFFELISVLVAIGRIISKEFMTDLLRNTSFLLPVAVD